MEKEMHFTKVYMLFSPPEQLLKTLGDSDVQE